MELLDANITKFYVNTFIFSNHFLLHIYVDIVICF